MNRLAAAYMPGPLYDYVRAARLFESAAQIDIRTLGHNDKGVAYQNHQFENTEIFLTSDYACRTTS